MPQGLIWTLAFAPLIGVFLEGVVAGITKTAAGGYWWITLALNIGLSIVDERRVNAAGYKTGGAGAALLVPVYMWKRAAALGQQPWYLGVWIVCFISILLTS